MAQCKDCPLILRDLTLSDRYCLCQGEDVDPDEEACSRMNTLLDLAQAAVDWVVLNDVTTPASVSQDMILMADNRLSELVAQYTKP